MSSGARGSCQQGAASRILAAYGYGGNGITFGFLAAELIPVSLGAAVPPGTTTSRSAGHCPCSQVGGGNRRAGLSLAAIHWRRMRERTRRGHPVALDARRGPARRTDSQGALTADTVIVGRGSPACRLPTNSRPPAKR